MSEPPADPQPEPVPPHPAPSQPAQASASALRYHEPAAGPTAESLRDRDRWRELTDQSLAGTQAAAEKWRTGLAAFVTLATGGLLLKGPDAASSLTTGWLIPLSVLALGGLLAAIGGLWLALLAAAGTPAKLNLAEVTAKYGGVRQFEVASALGASVQLRWARFLVAGSLLLFVGAIGTWWWAPAVSASPSMIQVSTPAGPICGTLVGMSGGAVTVLPPTSSVPVKLPGSMVRDARIVTSC
jgi:hypothetical protein